MSKATAPGWNPEKRRLDELVPLEGNPFGKITEEKRRRLDEKLQQLGVFEAAPLDFDGKTLLGFNKRYHALLLRHGGAYVINVLVPDRALSDVERKSVILSSNVHEGDWVKELMGGYDDVMAAVGLELDFGSVDEQLGTEKAAAVEAEDPIVAQFSEKHDAIVIVIDNEIDLNHIREWLDLGKQASYKSTAVGQTLVITAKAFIERWSSKS